MINFKEQENFTAKQQLEKIHKITSSYEPRILPEDINDLFDAMRQLLGLMWTSDMCGNSARKRGIGGRLTAARRPILLD